MSMEHWWNKSVRAKANYVEKELSPLQIPQGQKSPKNSVKARYTYALQTKKQCHGISLRVVSFC